MKDLENLINNLNLSDNEKKLKLKKLNENLEKPVKIIGIGQTGVGKTELLRSIFKIGDLDINKTSNFKGNTQDYNQLKTGSTKSVTKDFFSFIIKNEKGFCVEFTDGPGLGESEDKEQEYIDKWIQEIPKHDLLYWVLDASSRDIMHIQKNIKTILDKTGFRDKLIIVLNKVDQILIPLELETKGVVGWNQDFNQPSKVLLKTINKRTDDIIDKLGQYANIEKEQIVVCSARKRWNHELVLNKMLDNLPKEKKIKVSTNRDVKDHTELMSDKAKIQILKN